MAGDSSQHKMFRFKHFLCFLVGVLTLLAAADVTGKWTAEVPGRGGNMMKVNMNLKADGEKLTGTVGGRMGDAEISDGKIDGQSISFTVVREFQENKITQSYKGKLDGDVIHFSVTIVGGPMANAPAREFDAKRD